MASFLGFPIFSIASGSPPWGFQASKTFAAKPPQAAPALPQLSPRRSQAVTGWHCAPACAAARLHPHPLLGCPGGAPSRGEGPRLSSPKGTHTWQPAPLGHRHGGSRWGTPGSPQGGDPQLPKHGLSLPPHQTFFPHYGYIFITMVKGDQLHLCNIPLHKTNRPGNWYGPVKYFIVWTQGVSAAARRPSQPQIPGIAALFLLAIPPFGLGAACR